MELNVAANYHNNNRLFAYVLVWLGARKLHSVESRRVVAGLHLAIGLGPSPLSRPVNSATSESRVAIQKYRDEVENDRKPGGVMATASICAYDFPSGASQDELCQPRSARGRAPSLNNSEVESSDQFRGLGGSGRTALAELALVEVEPQPDLVQASTATAVWVDGTLSGIMAGKRPARRPTGSN